MSEDLTEVSLSFENLNLSVATRGGRITRLGLSVSDATTGVSSGISSSHSPAGAGAGDDGEDDIAETWYLRVLVEKDISPYLLDACSLGSLGGLSGKERFQRAWKLGVAALLALRGEGPPFEISRLVGVKNTCFLVLKCNDYQYPVWCRTKAVFDRLVGGGVYGLGQGFPSQAEGVIFYKAAGRGSNGLPREVN